MLLVNVFFLVFIEILSSIIFIWDNFPVGSVDACLVTRDTGRMLLEKRDFTRLQRRDRSWHVGRLRGNCPHYKRAPDELSLKLSLKLSLQ